VWELIFLMVILKIPIVYLCWVVWWAVKSKPVPEEPAALQRVPITPRPWDDPRRRPRRRPRPPRPHGGPTRSYARGARVAHAASR
jgi:hypothetical protein